MRDGVLVDRISGWEAEKLVGEGPLVSVIVPTYNRADLLRQALDSVIGQEGAGRQFETEIIVVDDVSTDATLEIHSVHPPFSETRPVGCPQRRFSRQPRRLYRLSG